MATGAATALGELGINKIFGKGITIPKKFLPFLPPFAREFTQAQINQINRAHKTGGRLVINQLVGKYKEDFFVHLHLLEFQWQSG